MRWRLLIMDLCHKSFSRNETILELSLYCYWLLYNSISVCMDCFGFAFYHTTLTIKFNVVRHNATLSISLGKTQCTLSLTVNNSRTLDGLKENGHSTRFYLSNACTYILARPCSMHVQCVGYRYYYMLAVNLLQWK